MTTSATIVNDFCVGDDLRIQHTITGLLAQISASELGLHHTYGDATAPFATWDITTTSSISGQIVDAGTLQTDGSYTAQVAFTLTGSTDGVTGDTLVNFKPGTPTWAYIRSGTAENEHYTSEIFVVSPRPGGRYG